jgi:hypothetical protein
MKQASITLKLSKDHSIEKSGITPLEAMFFVAEHHKNVGECPVVVIPGTESDIKQERVETEQVKIRTDKVQDPKFPEDKTKTIDMDVFEERPKKIIGTRTDNEEIFRLKQKYGVKKITALTTAFKDLPQTFAEALKLGVGVVLPTGSLSETKAF